MPTQLQLRRGNTAQTATFTGAVAEITVDTDKKTIVVHDGTTPGGFPLALQSTQFDQLAFTKANLASDRANSSFAQANLAYDAANTKFNSTGGTISGNVIVTGNVTPNTDNIYSLGSAGNRWKDLFVGPGSINIDGIVIGNNGGQIVISGASDFVFQSTTGAPSVSSSASANIAINAFNQANLAFSKANSANGIAVSAFAQANLAYDAANSAVTTGQANVGASVITLSNNITNVFNQANLAFNAANNAAGGVDAWVRNQANSAYDRANSSFDQANLAYTTANNALPKTGGTITGDLAVTGNLIITGTTTTLNVTSLSVSDTLIQLGKENQTDLLDIGFIGRYANTPNNHTGLIRKFSDGKYYLFDNLQTNNEPTNTIDIANTRVATLSANLVTNVITLRGLDPLDYSNTIYSNAQANVGSARIDANTANTTLAASIASGRQADNANLGASIITVTNAYEANVGAGLISTANTVTSAYQANVGAGLISTANTVTLAYQANVGSARIDANTANTTLAASIASGRQADNANLGATIITVTNAYEANVGAGLISTANTVTLAYQANVGSAIAQGQANVGASVITLSNNITNVFNQANLAYNAANSVVTTSQANVGASIITLSNNITNVFNQANLAYDAANSAVTTGQANVGAARIVDVASGQANVGAGLITVTSAYQANVGSGLITEVAARQANVGASVITVSNNITNVFNQANLAYDAANTAVTTGQANVGAGLISTANTITLAYQANVGAGLISTANTVTTAYQANVGAGLLSTKAAYEANIGASVITLTTSASNAFNHANSAFNKANNALPTTGGSIAGDLAVTGNLTISGTTTTLNVTTLSVTDTLIQLGTQNQSDLLDIGFIGHYANTPNNHTGLIRKFSDGKYYLFDNLLTNNEPTNTIDIANTRVATLSANLITNVITLRGLDPLDYSNTIYSNAQANTGAAALAGQANVGAGLITITSAYQANVGAGLISTANTITLAYQANVGAGLITVTSAYEANVGAGLISTANTITSAYQANVGAGLISTANTVTLAYQANVGAGLLSTKSAYEANVGAGLISTANTVTLAYQANVGAGLISTANTITLAYQANVGAGLLAYQTTSQANVGNAISTVTSAYQANVGAGLIGKLSLTGGTISGNVTANSFIANNSIYSPVIYSTGALSRLDLSDIGLVGITVAGQTFQFGGSGIESSPGIFGGSFAGNRLSLNSETNLISNRLDIVKIQTGTGGNTVNEWSFANNQLIFPDTTIQNTAWTGADVYARNTANLAYTAANSAVTTGQANVGAGLISTANTITLAYQANVGAGLITVTSAYQANVGAGLISTANTITLAYQANVGAGLISTANTITLAYQANVGAGLITSAGNINSTNDIASNASFYPVFVSALGTVQSATSSNTKLYFNPSTGTLNATIFNSLSDITSKEEIQTIENSLEKVLQLRGVSFKWKDTGNKSIGLIAQEVEPIIPEVVNTNEDGIKSVSYDSIVGLLIEAIKDQQTQIDELKKIIKGENK